ncbi:PKD domain-containing protein [Psychroserpens sp. XS_ASV72]|uniref:PKD domain-containing protein n=1 Tax=Psychroserpens sp. XS_ASV72 TaxID=3241293 RepID=UPI00351194EE
MGNKKYVYFGFIFFIIVGTAIAFNNIAKTSVFAPPTVDFTFDNNTCSGQVVSFTSNVTGDGPFDYTWNFGDGSTSTQANPNHVFNAYGCGNQNFIVSLTVTDDNGETSTDTQTITIMEEPDVDFEDLNAGFDVPFENCNAASIDYLVSVGIQPGSDTCVTTYNINWGDGSSNNNVTFPIDHVYTTLGTFNMTITAVGTNGCEARKTYSVANSSNPTGGIVSPGSTVNLCTPIVPLEFAISNWGENPPDTVYNINYGDGTTLSLSQNELESSAFYDSANPAASADYPVPHEYTESNCPNANYTVYLDIITSCGISNFTAGPITILQRPDVSFEVDDSACQNTTISIDNTSSAGYNPGCSEGADWFWDMGDGTTYTDFEPNHSYTSPGVYTISLYAENYCGQTTPVTQDICIEPPLSPTFTVNNTEGCAPYTTVLNNTTSLIDQCDTPSYQWTVNYTAGFCGTSSDYNFVNGTDANSENPQIEFLNGGTYEIVLEATNSCGSVSSTPQEVIVKSPPQIAIDAIPDLCESDGAISVSAVVDNCGPDTPTYSWSINVGTSPTDWQFVNGTNANSQTPEIEFYTPNTYILSLEITNDCGTNSDTEEFVFSAVPEITNTDLTQTICSGTSTADILLQADDANTMFTWSGNSPTGNVSGVIASGTTDTIPEHVLTLTSGTTGTVVYTVVPFLVDSCPGDPVEFTITVDEGPSIGTQPQDASYCLDATAELLSFSLNGNTSGTISYQWYVNDTGSNDPTDGDTTPIPAPEGEQADYQPPTDSEGILYYFCVISFSGTGSCSEITTVPAAITITPNVAISDELPLDQLICTGANPEVLSFSINNGGAGNVNYAWYLSDDAVIDASDTQVGSNATYDPGILNTAGTYYYYVTVDVDENLGCSDVSSAIFTIEVVDDPEVSVTPLDQTICTNASVDELVAIVSGGIDANGDGAIDNSDYNFQWFLNSVAITGATASTYNHDTSLPAGVYEYYCVVSQANDIGCDGTSNTVTITVNDGPSITQQPISAEYCLGDTILPLEIGFSSGVGTPTIQWYSNDTNDTDTPNPIGTDATTLTITDTNVGTVYYYAVISFSQGGCGDLMTDIVQITINQVPEISDYEALICSNNQFTVTPDETNGDIVPANTTYTWTAPVVNPAGSINGASDQVTPVNTISQFLENITTNPATVTYTVTPTSGDCVGETFEVVVTVNPSITVTSTVVNNNCFQSNNASINIDIVGGVPFTSGAPYVISWTGPNGFTSSDEDIINLEAGTYTLSIDDDGGCPYSESFTIEEPEEFLIDEVLFDPETISCFGANDGSIGITIIGGTMPYVYSWTKDSLPFSNDEDLDNLGPGLYEITVTDANNCGPLTQSFLIEEPQPLVVTLNSQTDVICFGEATGAISINVAGGRPDYSFSWTGPDGYTSNTQNIDTLFQGTYTITVTDSSDCVEVLDFTINQNDEIMIDVTTTEIECYGDNNASITINDISGGVPPYDIAWSNFGTGLSQVNLSAGIYTITITDAENCEKAFPIEIEEAPLFLIDPVVTQMSCAGENDASITLNLVGGIDPITVVWDDDATVGVERNNLAPGTYTVTITDGTPCVIQESFTINDIAPLLLSANITNALDCDDTNSGAINLLIQGGTPPFDVQWNNGATTEDLESIPPNFYSVVVTDANGCEVEGNWEVTRFEPLVVDVETQSEFDCEAKTVDQTFIAMASGGVPPYQFNWSSGNVSGLNNEMMTTEVNGLVILDVTDSLGCTTNYTFNVETPVLGDPGFEVSSIGLVNYGIFAIQDPIQFTNEATGDFVSILWDFGDGSFSAEENPTHTYVQVGNYVVTQTVTYPFGCVYTHIVTLIVEDGYKLIMPDAFTPNEDGLNDYFAPEHIGLNTLELNIYDTWGSLIYSESGDDIRGWDGKINDESAENGNYYYTFKASTFYDDVIEKQGAFVFIK